MGAEFTDVDTDIDTAAVSGTYRQVLAYLLPTMLLSLIGRRWGRRERETHTHRPTERKGGGEAG